jgi:hypothetical protein
VPALKLLTTGKETGPSSGRDRSQPSARTRQEFLSFWRAEAATLKAFSAMVDPERLIDAVLADAEAVWQSEDHDVLTLTEAAEESGYSAGHLGRLVRDGVIANAGRPNAPKIRRTDVPRKAAQLPQARRTSKIGGVTPTQIARAVVTSDREDPR